MNWLSDEEKAIREFAAVFAKGVLIVIGLSVVCLFVVGLAHQLGD